MARRLAYEQVKHFIEVESKSEYKLISEDYINNTTPLIIQCNKNHIYKASYTLFKQGSRCPTCNNENKRIRQTNSYEYVKTHIENNSNLKLVSKEYINNETPLEMCCEKEHLFKKSFGNFLRGQRCPICQRENRKGENSPSWNPELTQEHRENGRNVEGYSDWIYSVYERDNYICQCCGVKGNGNINSHHLDGYNWCKEKRLDVDNGVTLCDDCHKNFHINYGYGDNTKEQFYFWILDNGIGMFNKNKIHMSEFKKRPKKKQVIDAKQYFRNYYLTNGRKYSEEYLDVVFIDIISENKHPKYLTTKGFYEVSGINSITYSKIFKTDWLGVLAKYGKLQQLVSYVAEEYLNFYLENYNCNFENFYKSHKYITQQLVMLLTREKIKIEAGFKNSTEQHNELGFIKNMNSLIQKIGRVPFYNEFMKYTKIPIKSHLLYYNMKSQNYDKIVEYLIKDNSLLKEYELQKQLRQKEISIAGGKKVGELYGYSKEEKEKEFRRVFDEFYKKFNRYPSTKEFSKISVYSDNAYRKYFNLSWQEVKLMYGYQ